MAEAARSKHRTIVRAWWGLAALGSIAVAFVYGVVRLRRSQPEPEQNASGTAPTENMHRHNPTTAYEPSDWSLRPVALIYVAIPVLLVISCFVLIVAYSNTLPDVDRTLHIAPPGPRLQTDAAGDLQKFRADEERRLNTYYWIDRGKGIVHIPIDEAMKKLAATGAPGFPKGQGQP
jgi:heme/copper-type cytochrome/quinol oxidase subunit 2